MNRWKSLIPALALGAALTGSPARGAENGVETSRLVGTTAAHAFGILNPVSSLGFDRTKFDQFSGRAGGTLDKIVNEEIVYGPTRGEEIQKGVDAIERTLDDNSGALALGGSLLLGAGATAALKRMRRRGFDDQESGFLEDQDKPDSFFRDSRSAQGETSTPKEVPFNLSQLDAIGDVDLIVEADVYLDYGRLNEAIEILEASANQENSVEKIIKIGLKIIELLKKGFPEKSEDIDKMVDRDTEDSFREEFMSFVVGIEQGTVDKGEGRDWKPFAKGWRALEKCQKRIYELQFPSEGAISEEGEGDGTPSPAATSSEAENGGGIPTSNGAKGILASQAEPGAGDKLDLRTTLPQVTGNSQESADEVIQLHIVALANQSDISDIKTNILSVLVDTNLNPEQKIECISRAIRFTMEHKPISSLPSTHTSADNHEDTTLVDTTRYTIGPYIVALNELFHDKLEGDTLLAGILSRIAENLNQYCELSDGKLIERTLTGPELGQGRTETRVTWDLKELITIDAGLVVNGPKKIELQRLFRSILIENITLEEKTGVFGRILTLVRLKQNKDILGILIETLNKLDSSEYLSHTDLQEIMKYISGNSNDTIELHEGSLRIMAKITSRSVSASMATVE